MNRALQISIVLMSMIVITSCGSSNSVVNKGLIQKRKHTSGWFIKANSIQIKRSSSIAPQANDEIECQKDTHKNKGTKKNILNETGEANVTAESDNSILIGINTIPKQIDSDAKRQNNRITSIHKKDKTQTVVPITNDEITKDKEIAPEEKNKVAIASFVAIIIASMFISIGFAIMISSETFFILIFGLAILLTSIILSILALTKYGHQEKGKVLAKITLYTILLAPIVLLIIGFIIMSQSPYFN